MPPEVLWIEWDDAVAGTGWQAADDVESCQRCTSVGLLVAEDETRITLGGTWGMNGDQMETNNRMTIPKGFIVSRRHVLEPPKKPI